MGNNLLIRLIIMLAIGAYGGMPDLCFAGAKETFVINIKDHKFDPPQLTVPANQKFLVKVINQDPTAEEFESYDLNREKIVNGNKNIIVYLGPLSKGSYKYFGDFHQSTAQGTVIAQ